MQSFFIKGPLQMLGSAFIFAVMAYFGKLASVKIPGAEIAFIRFGVGVLAALILAGSGVINLHTNHKKLLITRGVFGGGAVLLYFLALGGGSLTNSTILNNTYPLFATLVAVFTFHEKISPSIGLSMTASWLGVWFLVHPDFSNIFWPDWVALLSGMLGGVAVAIIRDLRQKNESSWNVFFYLSLFGCIFSFLVAIPVWVWPDIVNWILLMVTAFLALIAQLMFSSSLKYCSTAVGGVLSMTTTIFASLIGIFVLEEIPTTGEAIGASLIVVSSIAVVWLSGRMKSNVPEKN